MADMNATQAGKRRKQSGNSLRISFRMPAALYHSLCDRSEKEQRTMSSIVFRAVRREMTLPVP
jgi:hypothetical protein